MIAAVLVMTVIAAGAVALTRSTPRPPASDGDRLQLELPGGFVVSVSPDSTSTEGAAIYVGLMGPEPRFDPQTLGIEIALTPRAASELVMPPSKNPLERNAIHASTMVYLGDLKGAQLALQVVDGGLFGLFGTDQLCVFWGNGTPVTGGGTCPVTDRPKSGFAGDPPIGDWLLWTQLPQQTAAVQMELPDGSTYWQRPAARTVFFNLPDGSSLNDASLSALDAEGNVIRLGVADDPIERLIKGP
jgi:hypothetical protein